MISISWSELNGALPPTFAALLFVSSFTSSRSSHHKHAREDQDKTFLVALPPLVGLFISMIPSSHQKDDNREAVDDDSDDEMTSEARPRLSWRTDPMESLSDWTIEIVSEQDGLTVTDSYHVHKCVLTLASMYFDRLIKSAHYRESADQTSRIELHELAAKAFPAMLDYVYGGDLLIETDSASALYHLAQYFEVRLLRRDAKRFWTEDLCLESCATYCEHAQIFHDDKLLSAVAALCAKVILFISVDMRVVTVSRPEFWRVLLQSLGQVVDITSKHISCLLTHVLQLYPDMDEQLFRELTDAKYLPSIDSKAVMLFLEAESTIAKESDAAVVTSLQDRCVEALAGDWECLEESHEGILHFLGKQSPLLVSHLLGRSLALAQKKVKTLSKELGYFKPLPKDQSLYWRDDISGGWRPSHDALTGPASYFFEQRMDNRVPLVVYYYDNNEKVGKHTLPFAN